MKLIYISKENSLGYRPYKKVQKNDDGEITGTTNIQVAVFEYNKTVCRAFTNTEEVPRGAVGIFIDEETLKAAEPFEGANGQMIEPKYSMVGFSHFKLEDEEDRANAWKNHQGPISLGGK